MKNTVVSNIKSFNLDYDSLDIPSQLTYMSKLKDWKSTNEIKTLYVNTKHRRSNAAAIREAVKLLGPNVDYFCMVRQGKLFKNDSEVIFYTIKE